MSTATMVSTALLFLVLTGGMAMAGSEASSLEIGRLLSPVGGESWSVGSIHHIRWTPASHSDDRTVRLEYSGNGGAAWKTIADAAANTGEYLW